MNLPIPRSCPVDGLALTLYTCIMTTLLALDLFRFWLIVCEREVHLKGRG